MTMTSQTSFGRLRTIGRVRADAVDERPDPEGEQEEPDDATDLEQHAGPLAHSRVRRRQATGPSDGQIRLDRIAPHGPRRRTVGAGVSLSVSVKRYRA